MEIKIDNSAQDYLKSLKYMENRVNEIIKNQNDELAWLLSHPAIYTSGSTDHKSDLLNNNKIPVIKTNRGGKYTYHGPGQRVVYLMINLNNRKKELMLNIKSEILKDALKENKLEITEVTSPTFNLLSEYQINQIKINHYDLFRLKSIDEVKNLDLFDNNANTITLIEWPQLIKKKPKNLIELFFEYGKNNLTRYVQINGLNL